MNVNVLQEGVRKDVRARVKGVKGVKGVEGGVRWEIASMFISKTRKITSYIQKRILDSKNDVVLLGCTNSLIFSQPDG